MSSQAAVRRYDLPGVGPGLWCSVARRPDVKPKRFGRFGLTLHPEKTKLVRFTRPRRRPGSEKVAKPKPGTFDLLAFTHYWGRSRRGRWIVKRKTAKACFSRAPKKIAHWCRANRHISIDEQHRAPTRKLRGHDA